MVGAEYKVEHLSDKQEYSGRLNHDVVRLDYDWEVIYWCMVLQVTKNELVDAVKRVGTSVSDIRNLIKKN